MRVAVVEFPSGQLLEVPENALSQYTNSEAKRYLIPVKEGQSALKVVRSLTPSQREIMKSFVDEECTSGELGIYFNAARTIRSLERKRLIKINIKQCDYFYVELA
jgi:hypothetical protein